MVPKRFWDRAVGQDNQVLFEVCTSNPLPGSGKDMLRPVLPMSVEFLVPAEQLERGKTCLLWLCKTVDGID